MESYQKISLATIILMGIAVILFITSAAINKTWSLDVLDGRGQTAYQLNIGYFKACATKGALGGEGCMDISSTCSTNTAVLATKCTLFNASRGLLVLGILTGAAAIPLMIVNTFMGTDKRILYLLSLFLASLTPICGVTSVIFTMISDKKDSALAAYHLTAAFYCMVAAQVSQPTHTCASFCGVSILRCSPATLSHQLCSALSCCSTVLLCAQVLAGFAAVFYQINIRYRDPALRSNYDKF